VGADGSQIGIVSTQDALRQAQDLDLDLVEVAPQANPPVARIMDYGKFKYERDIRQKEARKKQARIEVKEIKFRPKIDPHDYATKKGHVERFLRTGARVKVTIMFRGREQTHPERGERLRACAARRGSTRRAAPVGAAYDAQPVDLAGAEKIHALACDTDGIDGSEDNAGAILAPDSLARAGKKKLDAAKLLADNDGYGFFSALGDLVVTGPTRTNVNDYRCILVMGDAS